MRPTVSLTPDPKSGTFGGADPGKHIESLCVCIFGTRSIRVRDTDKMSRIEDIQDPRGRGLSVEQSKLEN